MISDFDIDWDGFQLEIDECQETLIEKHMTYEDLLSFSAQMMAERNYAEVLYGMACADMDSIKMELMNMVPDEVFKNKIKLAFEIGQVNQKTATGKHAVSYREDQLLKANWQQHVIACITKGMAINNLNDLLDVPGYSEKASRVQAVTLKAWAKEAAPSLIFKAGRPPASKPKK